MGAEQSNVVISEEKRSEMNASLIMTVVSEQEDKSERIIQCAATASSNAVRKPYFIARSLPHNALSSTDANTQENNYEFFDKLLQSTVVYDSASDTADITKPDCLQFIHYYLPGKIILHVFEFILHFLEIILHILLLLYIFRYR